MKEKLTSQGQNRPQDVVSEPSGITSGISQRLSESGIIQQLRYFGKEDTVWLIHLMQRHLEELSDADVGMDELNPLDALEQLGAFVRETGKSPEQLKEEFVHEKYAV